MGIYDIGSSGALSDVLLAEQKEKHILTIKFPHPFFFSYAIEHCYWILVNIIIAYRACDLTIICLHINRYSERKEKEVQMGRGR